MGMEGGQDVEAGGGGGCERGRGVRYHLRPKIIYVLVFNLS